MRGFAPRNVSLAPATSAGSAVELLIGLVQSALRPDATLALELPSPNENVDAAEASAC